MPTTARIIGTGAYLPPKVVTNDDLRKTVSNFDEKRAKASFGEWAEKVTGIRRRRHCDGESAEQMAAKACKQALKAAGVKKRDVDLLIVGTFTGNWDIPNPAIRVCHLLGIHNIPAFPINTACAGFVYGIATAYSMIRSDMAETALVVSAEALTGVVDFSDPKTAILFGDGAGAAVVQKSDKPGLCGPPFLSAEYSEYITQKTYHSVPREESITHKGTRYVHPVYLQMPGGPKVLKNAVDAMANGLQKALARTPYKLDDLDYIVPHQANARITRGLIKKLGVPAEKVCDIVADLGNTSGSTVAIALDRVLRGEIDGYTPEPGHKIGLTALGGGYSLAAAVMEV
jgi:3-oxoacyl-[acyl-carrier-protein] synthase-3